MGLSVASSPREVQAPLVERLLVRIRASLAQVIKVVAPAGFGKTTLTQALRQDYDATAVCDCAGVQDATAFVVAVVEALAHERPGRYESTASVKQKFEQISDEFGRHSALAAQWEIAGAQSLFIFENVEEVLGQAEIASLFTRLIGTAPACRRVVVCSRAPLPARAGRYLPPHRMLSLGPEDLALTETEAKTLLASYDVPERYVEPILETARGWPVVLHLMARLAGEGALERVLANSTDIAFDDLFAYFLEEIIRPMGAVEKRALAACAAVPDIDEQELSGALEMPLQESLALLRHAPLVYRQDNSFSAHPLLRNLLMQDPVAKELQMRVAHNAYAQRRFARAARIYVHAGDIAAAAGALSQLSLRELHSGAVARELIAMPPEMLRRYPRLMAAYGFKVLGLSDLMLAEEIFDALTAEEAPETVAIVANAFAQAQIDCKRYYEIARIIDDPRVARIRAMAEYRDLFVHLQARLVAMNGSFTTAVPLLEHAYNVAVRAGNQIPAISMANALALTYRWLGDRAQSLRWMHVAVTQSHHLAPLPLAETLSCALWNAWFWKDDEAFAVYLEQLRVGAAAGEDAMFSKLLRAMEPQHTLSELPLYNNAADWRALLIAYCACDDQARRRELLDAIDCNDAECPEGVGHAVTALIHSVVEPSRAQEWLARAYDTIDERELGPLHEAIGLRRSGLPTFLDAFLERFARKGTQRAAVTAAAVRVEILTETILIHDQSVRLTSREAALIAFLSVRRLGASREEIQDALWPDLDDRAARDSLYSLIYRLRKRTKNYEVIANIGNGYRFAEGVCVDLWEVDMLAQRVARDPRVAAQEVRAAHDCLAKRSYPHLLAFDWFTQLDFRIRENAHTLARRLVDDAFAAGNSDDAILLANQLLQYDSCDEFAYTALMRAQLDKGDRNEAARIFRLYESNIVKQLAAVPSEDIVRFARQAGLAIPA
ncbi:MAG TPA: BTAD domain-containing putative transcriptional regulator [Candidatus Baltobacteraceae bacterium]|jgi:DNA-binding SARP family transcriptional activator|nr:BTAD domain-containing putative transcriptional regulator [Candidatus Baltobacteraceae bacterium]